MGLKNLDGNYLFLCQRENDEKSSNRNRTHTLLSLTLSLSLKSVDFWHWLLAKLLLENATTSTKNLVTIPKTNVNSLFT